MIRLMEEIDLGEIADIESECFSAPWSETLLLEVLTSPIDYIFVVEDDSQAHRICAYSVLRIIADEAEIQRIAVKQQLRRQGNAGKLMDAMTDFSRKKNVKSMILEVREHNENARKLYKTYGFYEEGIRRNYYQSPVEDAILMRRSVL